MTQLLLALLPIVIIFGLIVAPMYVLFLIFRANRDKKVSELEKRINKLEKEKK